MGDECYFKLDKSRPIIEFNGRTSKIDLVNAQPDYLKQVADSLHCTEP